MAMNQKKRIIIIDDHPLFREGLKSIIAKENRYEVIGEAGTGSQGLQKARELKPDLALVDVSLPDQSGIELIREILQCSPQTLVLIVSMHSKVDYIVKAFQTGAMGYIVKESAADMLLKGMDQVFQGNYFMDTSVSHQVVKKLIGMPPKETVANNAGYDTLTPREQEVVILLAEGLAIKQIADRLYISPKTVENHRSNIMHKLGLHSTMEVIRFAAKLGLIDINLWKE
jgi:DNA-binding NarL/FixJ family response regulator